MLVAEVKLDATGRELERHGAAINRTLDAIAQVEEVCRRIDPWSTYRHIQQAIEIHDRLAPLLDAARAQLAPPSRKGKQSKGKQADLRLYAIILDAWEIYEQLAANPLEPTTGGGAESIRFLQAALRPLGIDRNDNALTQLYKRARDALPRDRVV